MYAVPCGSQCYRGDGCGVRDARSVVMVMDAVFVMLAVLSW